jgi:hypothetical protein
VIEIEIVISSDLTGNGLKSDSIGADGNRVIRTKL